ncbi:aminoacyl--tRNA ligase-related protein [Paenibacillus xylanilyticus]|uniref:aminoacyl--tRNA ligase-related protein n=1 Tax=Paenibacillus xylanilyticus TaxID=248903 RepID=UPI003AAAD4E4
MERIYSTKGRLSPKQVEALFSKLIYSIEEVSNCYLDTDQGDICIETTAEANLEAIDETVNRLIEQQQGIRPFAVQTLHEHDGFSLDSQVIDEEQISTLFNGNLKKDAAVILYEAIDEKISQYAKSLQASLRSYPSMIDKDVLETCHYIESFPQNLYAVSEFPHRNVTLEKVREDDNYQQHLRDSTKLLSPAVCFHCYAEYKNRTLEQPVLLTAAGNCFRHEAPWRLGQHRLSEFKMREIVFIGSPDFVEETRTAIMKDIWELFVGLGMSGKIETAHDPFYFPKDAIKQQYQLMSSMKFELIAEIKNRGSAFSIASFNNVKDTLCKEFLITNARKEFLHSGCVAFGIDRWVYAILETYGTNTANWPASLTSQLPADCIL